MSHYQFFSKKTDYTENEIQLITFLESLISKSEEVCRKEVENNRFKYLDSWNKKIGFTRRLDGEYQVLSLSFRNKKCAFYQILIKKEDDRWTDGYMIDYDIVRKVGIVE